MTQLDKRLIMIILLGAAALFGFRFFPVADSGLKAEVILEGRTVQTLSVTENDGRIIRVAMPRGIAELEIKDGAVRVLEMPDDLCPRKICSHTGWIRRSGETIICAPNRLMVRLVQDKAAEMDAITR